MSSPSGSTTAATGSASSPRTARALSSALANADEVKRPDPGSWRGAPDEEAALPLAPADHVKRPLASRERNHPRWHPRRHPRAERIIPKSRDFH